MLFSRLELFTLFPSGFCLAAPSIFFPPRMFNLSESFWTQMQFYNADYVPAGSMWLSVVSFCHYWIIQVVHGATVLSQNLWWINTKPSDSKNGVTCFFLSLGECYICLKLCNLSWGGLIFFFFLLFIFPSFSHLVNPYASTEMLLNNCQATHFQPIKIKMLPKQLKLALRS